MARLVGQRDATCFNCCWQNHNAHAHCNRVTSAHGRQMSLASFLVLARLPPAPAGAAAGLIDEDWGAGTSGAGRTPPRNSIQPVNWIQLSDQPYQRKADGAFQVYLHWSGQLVVRFCLKDDNSILLTNPAYIKSFHWNPKFSFLNSSWKVLKVVPLLVY